MENLEDIKGFITYSQEEKKENAQLSKITTDGEAQEEEEKKTEDLEQL